jgi:hypothetical protein
MDASVIISLVALLISAVSLYFAIGREGRDRIRFEEEQERTAQQARLGLSAIYKEGPTAAPGGHEYRYELVNTSEVPIDNPAGWLVDEEGIAASSRTLGTPAYMLPKERGELRILARSLERPLTLHLAWLDVRGEHPDKTSHADVPLEPGGGSGRGN